MPTVQLHTKTNRGVGATSARRIPLRRGRGSIPFCIVMLVWWVSLSALGKKRAGKWDVNTCRYSPLGQARLCSRHAGEGVHQAGEGVHHANDRPRSGRGARTWRMGGFLVDAARVRFPRSVLVIVL